MDYKTWLTLPPYGWTQKEKEAHYLPYFKALTKWHQQQCHPYGRALTLLGYDTAHIDTISQLPMLPIGLFKEMALKSIADEAVFKVLVSSGTTGQAVSRIFLDAETARNQQLILAAIGNDFFKASRLPMLIIDSSSIFKSPDQFTARGAAILGFSMFAKKKIYALDSSMNVDLDAIRLFIEKYASQPFIIFGFTFMIWKYLYLFMKDHHQVLDLSNAVVLHGGGWKKMQHASVSPSLYKKCLQEQLGITHIHNYYGMAEQTGCIYMECEYGHLHASIFSDIVIRDPIDFSLCPIGKPGIIQVLSPIATSYPGHSLLTEDMGVLLGIDDCPCGRKGKYFTVTGRIPAAEIRGCSDSYGN